MLLLASSLPLGKSVDADWLGVLSSGCIAFAAVLIALGAGRGELSGVPKGSAYLLLGISIVITAGKLLGVLPHLPS